MVFFLYYIGCLNSRLGSGIFKVVTYTNFTSTDDSKNALKNMFDSLATNPFIYFVRMAPSGGGTTYVAYVYKAGESYGFVNVESHSPDLSYIGKCVNGNWTWDSYALKSNLSDFIKISRVTTAEITVAANSVGSVECNPPAISGYTLLSAVNVIANFCVMAAYYNNNDVWATNTKNTSQTGTFTVTFLYIKSDYIS